MIQFIGNGEPLLNKNIVSMIADVKKFKITEKIRLITNGILLNGSRLKDITKAGVDEIHISLDTVSEKKYMQIKKADELQRVLGNIRNAIEFIEKKHRPILYIKYFTKSSSVKFGVQASDSEGVVEEFYNKAHDSKYIHLKEQPLFDSEKLNQTISKQQVVNNKSCMIPFYLMYITHSGQVSACCTDIYNQLTTGNLIGDGSSSINNIIESSSLYNIRKAHFKGRIDSIPLCLNCENVLPINFLAMKNDTKELIKKSIIPL